MTEEQLLSSALAIHACGYAAVPCFVFAFRDFIPPFWQKLLNFPIALAKLLCAIWVGFVLLYTVWFWNAMHFKVAWIPVCVVLIAVEMHLFIQKCKRCIK